jgi:septal ring factor EnvC (AmiA/AmiB activator)
MTRESQRLRYEISSRERRIQKLEVELASARQGELAQLERRRQQLEIDLQAEREAIKRANDRLKELEQSGVRPPATKPPPNPPAKPPTTQPPAGRQP